MRVNYEKLKSSMVFEKDENTKEIEELMEYEEIVFEISKKINDYRREKCLTQKQLAEILNVNQVMIAKLESGKYNPTFKQLHKISRKLTNSSKFFIEILNDIILNLEDMNEYVYKASIKQDMKAKKEIKNEIKKENNNLKTLNYDFRKLEGGFYGTEECTSTLSIA